MKKAKSGTSPYVRYSKAPYSYSTEYQNWKAAVLKNVEHEISYWAKQHNRKFGLYSKPHNA